MRINFCVGQTNFINVQRINQSIATQNANNSSVKFSKAERRDTITISPQGKANSLLESLMKQKTRINEQRNSLITSTLEKGDTLDVIETQLEAFEEQIKNIEEQITKAMTEDMGQQVKKSEKQGISKPKTEEEIQNERIASLTNLSTNFQQAKTINSVKTNIDSDARVLKFEIEMDKTYAGSSVAADNMIAKKETVLEEMNKKSLDLTSDISGKLSDITDNFDKINKPNEILPDDKAQSKADETIQTSETLLNDIQNENIENISE